MPQGLPHGMPQGLPQERPPARGVGLPDHLLLVPTIDVIERYHSLILMTDDLDIDHHPERLALLPKTPHMCEYCPFYSPTPQDPYQCQGDTK